MKAKTFTMSHETAKEGCLHYVSMLPTDGSVEVIIRNASEGKTMQQLGALFGVWEKHLSEKHGHSIDKVHSWIKARFLARIYVTEPVNELQEQWVELLAVYQQAGLHDKLEKHAKRIRLAWASLKQTKTMMNELDAHFQDIGQPLPALEKDWRLR